MEMTEIKTMLHESIENIDDPAILLAMQEIAGRKYTPQDPPHLSPNQILRIEESTQQIREGLYVTNEEADALVDEWLNG
ncbi:MAG: hypothetical protein CVV45_09720 [Spirochaetae bacterium HGW-Spirochaetae-10]|jgi:hypothetical protein|nr:MAG: hypothetical protein CVV45_09720 [Spirochaetae bacterium HGW-Spirochaetae-10]